MKDDLQLTMPVEDVEGVDCHGGPKFLVMMFGGRKSFSSAHGISYPSPSPGGSKCNFLAKLSSQPTNSHGHD